MPQSANAELSASVKFTTNYIHRGYSKSNGNPSFQGDIDYEHSSGLFTGARLSWVDFVERNSSDHAHLEINPYLGWSYGLTDDWRIEALLAGYLYDNKILNRDANYFESSFAVHYRDLVTARFTYAPDSYGHAFELFTYELQTRYPLTDTFTLSAALGFEDGNPIREYDYLYWNIGASWFLHKNLAVDLRYHGLNFLHENHSYGPAVQFTPAWINSEVVFSISVGF